MASLFTPAYSLSSSSGVSVVREMNWPARFAKRYVCSGRRSRTARRSGDLRVTAPPRKRRLCIVGISTHLFFRCPKWPFSAHAIFGRHVTILCSHPHEVPAASCAQAPTGRRQPRRRGRPNRRPQGRRPPADFFRATLGDQEAAAGSDLGQNPTGAEAAPRYTRAAARPGPSR